HPRTLFPSFPAPRSSDLEALATAIGPLKTTLGTVHLLDGAPRKTVIDAMTAVEEILGGVADLLKLIEMLTGEELTVRFDWNPEKIGRASCRERVEEPGDN